MLTSSPVVSRPASASGGSNLVTLAYTTNDHFGGDTATVLFVADAAYQVMDIWESHDQGSVTALNFEKLGAGAALGTGAALLNPGFDQNTTDHNTAYQGTLTAISADLLLAVGDRIATVGNNATTSGTITLKRL